MWHSSARHSSYKDHTAKAWVSMDRSDRTWLSAASWLCFLPHRCRMGWTWHRCQECRCSESSHAHHTPSDTPQCQHWQSRKWTPSALLSVRGAEGQKQSQFRLRSTLSLHIDMLSTAAPPRKESPPSSQCSTASCFSCKGFPELNYLYENLCTCKDSFWVPPILSVSTRYVEDLFQLPVVTLGSQTKSLTENQRFTALTPQYCTNTFDKHTSSTLGTWKNYHEITAQA